MRRVIATTATVLLFLLIADPVRPVQVATDADGPTQEERLEEIRELKRTLDEARVALATLEERLRRAETGEPSDGTEANVEQLSSTVSEISSEVIEGGDALQEALVEFINSDPPIEGEPMPPAVAEALEIKASEDVALAQEYIALGGDYDRAIQIYEDVLSYAPGNLEAIAALERARELRFMDEERFARVEEGMSKDEVRDALGPVHFRNVRTYKDLGVEAWFYPKGPDGQPAAVYFREKGGQWEVHRAEFSASEPDR